MKINKDLIAVVMILIIGILYWNVTLRSPIVFGDEGFWAFQGRWVAENGIFPRDTIIWSTDIYHTPFISHPLFVLMLSAAWLLGGDLGIKLLLPVFSLLTALMLYIFVKRYDRPIAGLAAVIMFLATPTIVTYGVLSYTDTMALLLIMGSIYFGFMAIETGSKLHAGIGGILGGLALLTKITGYLPLILLPLYFIFSKKFKHWKPFLIFIMLFGVTVAPWLIRNIIMLGGPCFRPFTQGKGCDTIIDTDVPKYGLKFSGRTAEVGTETSVWKMGLLGWIRFAFGWTTPILFVFGLVALLMRKNRFDLLTALWFAIFIIVFFFTTTRAEDTARYVLPIAAPIAIITGNFTADAYEYIKKKSKLLSIFVILIIVSAIWFYGQEKLNTMTQVKAFSPGFFEACDWVKSNTPPNAILFGTYLQQAAYSCHRQVSYLSAADITLANNESSYELLKLYGYDYVWIPQFTVSITPYAESTPIQFVNWIETSAHFKKVFDNTNIYGQGGVRIYEVL